MRYCAEQSMIKVIDEVKTLLEYSANGKVILMYCLTILTIVSLQWVITDPRHNSTVCLIRTMCCHAFLLVSNEHMVFNNA